MKYYLSLLLMLICATAFSQAKKEADVIARSRLLNNTVFGTKDSLTLEDLFAKTATYGHSGGNVQTRQEAIRSISHNASTYTDTSVKKYDVIMNDDVAIVRYIFRETETREGKPSPLNLGIMLVWVREKGKWRLFGRQAVKLT
jgi:hypothetical protein